MTATSREPAGRPPRVLIRTFWVLHRFAHRATGGRFGLKPPVTGANFGMLRLATVGRRSGRARVAIVGYVEDGPNLVTIAMNGWGETEPAWWLNLQAQPDAEVGLPDGTRAVRARAAVGEERERLWASFRDYPGWGDDIDALAGQRPGQTAVVVLEPRPTGKGSGIEDGEPLLDQAAAPDTAHAAAVATPPSHRWLRPRLLWIVPGLAVAVYAGMQSDALGFGPLVPLAFGLAPHAGWVLGLAGIVLGTRAVSAGTASHNLLHQPILPAALVVAGVVGIVSAWWLVGGLAWLGHVVIGWGVGDGHKTAATTKPQRSTGWSSRLRRRPVTPSSEVAA